MINWNRVLTFVILAACMAAGGCAIFTAQRVGTFAAKEVGKTVVKKGIEHERERKQERDAGQTETTGYRSSDE